MEKTTTTKTSSNGDGKLPGAEEIELSFNKSFYDKTIFKRLSVVNSSISKHFILKPVCYL